VGINIARVTPSVDASLQIQFSVVSRYNYR